MKNHLAIVLLMLIFLYQPSMGQEKNIFSTHQLSIDFGSMRNRYLYPVTDIKYSAPLLKNINLKFSARIRSYGTLYFYSKNSYDFTPLAEYYFTKTINPVFFSAGIGLDARIRLAKDERSQAKSSVEPLLSLALHSSYKRIGFDIPLWTRLYSNGISFALLPEVSGRISKRFSLFLRYELSYLTIYKTPNHEWTQDCFIGTHFLF